MSATIKLSAPATRGFWEIPVLFEDADLLALDKPAGLLTVPEADAPAGAAAAGWPSLMELLHAGIADAKPWARQRHLTYLHHEHLLDADATGVLLCSKNKRAHTALADAFGCDRPRRKYIALVRGNLLEASFEVHAPIAPNPAQPGLMRVDKRAGKPATTSIILLENFTRAAHALVQCLPTTDRRHQIRVHLNHVELPIVADALYGGKKLWLSHLKRDFHLKEGREERPLLSRAALHAAELSVPHPVTGESIIIESEWPKDLRVAVRYLRKYSV